MVIKLTSCFLLYKYLKKTLIRTISIVK